MLKPRKHTSIVRIELSKQNCQKIHYYFVLCRRDDYYNSHGCAPGRCEKNSWRVAYLGPKQNL